MAIDHIAGAIGVWEIKGDQEGLCFCDQLCDGSQRGPGEMLLAPLVQSNGALAEGVGIRGVIDLPDLLSDVGEEGPPLLLAAIPDLEETYRKHSLLLMIGPNRTNQALRVANQPSMLIVCG